MGIFMIFSNCVFNLKFYSGIIVILVNLVSSSWCVKEYILNFQFNLVLELVFSHYYNLTDLGLFVKTVLKN